MADEAPGTPTERPAETPWALAQRLEAQGLPPSAVHERLLQAGLTFDDATTLLRALRTKSAAAQGPIDHEANLLAGMAKAGVGAATLFLTEDVSGRPGKMVLDGLLQVTAGVMQEGLADARTPPSQPVLAPPEQVAFEVPDGTPRCQVHPRLPSVDTCRRCGALACHTCAPKKGFGGTEFCTACEQQPSVLASRVKTAARRLAVAVFVEAVLLAILIAVAALPGPGPHPEWGSFPHGLALSLPFAVLGFVQWFVRHPWPGVVGAIGSGVLVFVTLSISSEAVPVELLMLLLTPMVAMLFALERLTLRRKAAGRLQHATGLARPPMP